MRPGGLRQVVCTDGVGNRDAHNVWPDSHELKTKRWSVGDSLGVDIFSVRHRPFVRDYQSREVIQFPGIWSTHNVTEVWEWSSLDKSVTGEVMHPDHVSA